MLELSKQGHDDMYPDTITYNSVIDAWAKSGDPSAGRKAESLLSEMLEQYKMGNEAVKPNTITFSSVIDAWANSRDPNAGMRARRSFSEWKNNTRWETRTSSPILSATTQLSLLGKESRPKAGMRAEAILRANGRTIQNGKRGRQTKHYKLQLRYYAGQTVETPRLECERR